MVFVDLEQPDLAAAETALLTALDAADSGRSMSPDTARRIALSLVSHTNVGKTTLARTLLDRDVGTVRDEPHVTDAVDRFTMIETPEGDALELWDTPGFGDSARLASRLAQSESPIGWFLGAVWDRFRDRPFWSTQLAVRNVRDNADCVLYLVNAAEKPADAGYVGPEMQVLTLIGKPVLVLLNQMGPPRPPRGGGGGARGLAGAPGPARDRPRRPGARRVRPLLGTGGGAPRCGRRGPASRQAAGLRSPAGRMAGAARDPIRPRRCGSSPTGWPALPSTASW